MVRLSAPNTAVSSRSAPAARNMAVRFRPTSIPARAKEIGSSATAENIAKLITLPIRAGSAFLEPRDRYDAQEARCYADGGCEGDGGREVRYKGDRPDDNTEKACQSELYQISAS